MYPQNGGVEDAQDGTEAFRIEIGALSLPTKLSHT